MSSCSFVSLLSDALIQIINKLDDTTFEIVEDQAIFDNDIKSIRLHQEDYEAKLESMLVKQQGVVDNMIKYLETVEDRMRELERRVGVPVRGPDLPRDPAPESLLRWLTPLRIAAEGVAPMEGPMESAPNGPPQVDPSLLRHIPLFSASVILGEKTLEKGSGIGTPTRDTRHGHRKTQAETWEAPKARVDGKSGVPEVVGTCRKIAKQGRRL